MSLFFDPRAEEELIALLDPGDYDFYVKNAEHWTSKTTGKPSIKLTLAVADKNGKEWTIFDYLSTNFLVKILHFCQATGLEGSYKKGEFSEHLCINKSGKVNIKIDEAQGNFFAKNSVNDYVKRDNCISLKKKDDLATTTRRSSAPTEQEAADQFKDDPLPDFMA